MGGDALIESTLSEVPRILVCGGRDFDDRYLLYRTLDKICEDRGWSTPKDEYGNWLPMVTIVSGMAKGADTIAVDYAVVNWTGLKVFPADWTKYGKKAGPIRNQQMIDEGKPNLVVAFAGGRGTADMVRRAKKAGIEVIEVNSS